MMSRTLGECETVKQTLLLDNEIKSNLLYYTLALQRLRTLQCFPVARLQQNYPALPLPVWVMGGTSGLIIGLIATFWFMAALHVSEVCNFCVYCMFRDICGHSWLEINTTWLAVLSLPGKLTHVELLFCFISFILSLYPCEIVAGTV